jgi:lysophospholipase L1-like esterase
MGTDMGTGTGAGAGTGTGAGAYGERGGSRAGRGGGRAAAAGKAGAGRRAAVMGAAALGGALALTAAAIAPASATSGRPAPAHHAPGHHAPGHHGGSHHGGGHHAPAVHYAALGDSYTSGPVIPTQIDANCTRSDHNYPHLVAAADHVRELADVSCGGATTAEMWKAQGTNPPQLTAVNRATTLVTLQIGGNDIGFSSIIATCAGLSVTDPAGSPCRQHYTAGGTDQLAADVVATAPKVAAALRAVQGRAPHARVVVVGYPDLLPDDGVGCFPAVPFAAGDFGYLRDTEKKLNTMLRAQALLHGDAYVDTYGPTVGHDMCEDPAVRWIEPLVPTSPAGPAHPNAKGEQAMAEAVLQRVGTPGHGHGG